MSLKKTTTTATAPKLSRGGQHEPAPLLPVPRALRERYHPNAAEAYVQSGLHARDVQANANRIERHLTIKASNQKLGQRTKEIETQQAKLRQELAFWEDPDEAWSRWDATVNNL